MIEGEGKHSPFLLKAIAIFVTYATMTVAKKGRTR